MKGSFVPNGPGACARHGPGRSEKGIPQMSRRTSPPFRADHVGSLLRPPRLHQAREDFAAGRIEAAGLRAVEDEEIGGIAKAPGHLAVKFTNPSGTIEWTPAALHVGSKVRMDQTIFGEDFTYL